MSCQNFKFVFYGSDNQVDSSQSYYPNNQDDLHAYLSLS